MQVTALSALGVPGGLHSFSAKNPGGGGGDAVQITALSPNGVPGRTRQFTEKGIVVKIPAPPAVNSSGPRGMAYKKPLLLHLEQLQREDEEILTMIMSTVEVIEWLH